MTPVIFLSDGYIGNGMEPWRFPKADELPDIHARFEPTNQNGQTYMPYARDERGVRSWAIPGTKGLEHRVGGLEKEAVTGNVSYDPDNHQRMVLEREEKVDRIADFIPEARLDCGADEGELLVLAWGSTFGACKTAVCNMINEGHAVSHLHLRHLRPFPRNLGDILKRFRKVVIPEINRGQLLRVIRAEYLVDAKGFNAVRGVPIRRTELTHFLRDQLESIETS
jgi:2-oxoglutarate ferredoxin oxidoreductase subunit alpha